MIGGASKGKRKKSKGGTSFGLGGDAAVDSGMMDDNANADADANANAPPEPTKDGTRRIVEEVLATNSFEQMRSSKMSQDDFLLLLATFNEKGVHFA